MARIAPLNIDWKPDRTTGEPVTEQIVGYMCEQVHSGNWPIGTYTAPGRLAPACRRNARSPNGSA